MKKNISTPRAAQTVRRTIMGLACLAGLGLNSCRLPSDPTRSLQTAGIFGQVTSSPSEADPSNGSSSAPVAEAAPGRVGFVLSPHDAGHRLVNVRNCVAGSEVRCPYTDKIFVVPDFTKMSKKPAALAYSDVPFQSFSLADDYTPTRVPLRPQPLQASDPAAIIKRLGLNVFSLDLSNPAADVGPMGILPFAKNVPGSPGMVYSPFARRSQLVDVAGLVPGVEVTCPYTGKLFRVPAPLPPTTALR